MHKHTEVVQFGKTPIEYELRRSKGRSTIAISVGLEEGVQVVAPALTKRPRVAQVVRSKAHWIVRQKRDLATIAPRPSKRLFRNGESVLILGQNHILKLHPVKTGERMEVK